MTIQEIYTLFSASTGVCTDTRTLIRGSIFFALKGSSFNGNAYAEAALKAGASYAVVDEAIETSDASLQGKVIQVPNTLLCLQQLSTYHRRQLGTTIIGITGSNGKTTTKELLASVLAQHYTIQYTKGNLNNHIGVPLSLLSITKDHEIAIIEMGANQLHDIKELCTIAEPDYGYITNIGDAHLEGFGSRAGVLTAKTELYKWVIDHGNICFVNQFDPMLATYPIPSASICYLSSELAVVSANNSLNISVNYQGQVVETQMTGSYNIDNINAAITIGTYFDVSPEDIIKGIVNYTPTNNRSQVIAFRGATVILDAYNANPSSMTKSLDNLITIKGVKTMAILGEMLELGEYEEEKHKLILSKALNSDINSVVTVGNAFYNISGEFSDNPKLTFFASTNACKQWLDGQSLSGYTILIKGSRGNKLETLVVN